MVERTIARAIQALMLVALAGCFDGLGSQPGGTIEPGTNAIVATDAADIPILGRWLKKSGDCAEVEMVEFTVDSIIAQKPDGTPVTFEANYVLIGPNMVRVENLENKKTVIVTQLGEYDATLMSPDRPGKVCKLEKY